MLTLQTVLTRLQKLQTTILQNDVPLIADQIHPVCTFHPHWPQLHASDKQALNNLPEVLEYQKSFTYLTQDWTDHALQRVLEHQANAAQMRWYTDHILHPNPQPDSQPNSHQRRIWHYLTTTAPTHCDANLWPGTPVAEPQPTRSAPPPTRATAQDDYQITLIFTAPGDKTISINHYHAEDYHTLVSIHELLTKALADRYWQFIPDRNTPRRPASPSTENGRASRTGANAPKPPIAAPSLADPVQADDDGDMVHIPF